MHKILQAMQGEWQEWIQHEDELRISSPPEQRHLTGQTSAVTGHSSRSSSDFISLKLFIPAEYHDSTTVMNSRL
jgi:hypothetical protein